MKRAIYKFQGVRGPHRVMEAIHNWVHENLELFRNLAKSQKFSMILSPCSKVQAGFLRLCAIPPGRVCAQHTPELACQVYMRVRVESAAEYWAQRRRSRGNGERRFAQHLAVGFPGRCVRVDCCLAAPLCSRRREASFGAARR